MSDRPKTSSADEWALWLDEWKGANTAFLAVQIAEAIEEQRADLLPVVKPLVWENILGEVWRSEHRRSHFYECLCTPDGWICYEMVHGVGRQIGDIWPDVEAAQATAQADYEARSRANHDMIDPADAQAALDAAIAKAVNAKLEEVAEATLSAKQTGEPRELHGEEARGFAMGLSAAWATILEMKEPE